MLDREVAHTSLRNSNHIMVLQDGWQAIGLDRSRNAVSTELDVLQHHRMQTSVRELASH